MTENPYPDVPPTKNNGVDMDNGAAIPVSGGGCTGNCSQGMRTTPDFEITDLHTEGPCSEWTEGEVRNRIEELIQNEWSHLTVGNTCNEGCVCGISGSMPYADYNLTGEVTFPIEEGEIRVRLKFNFQTKFGSGECRYAAGMRRI